MKKISELNEYDAKELLKYFLEQFGERIGLASSFSVEDQVVLDMLCELTDKPVVFTLDTGRLPQETFDVIEETRKRYGVDIEILFPDAKKVEEMVNRYGPNLFYESVELRKLCCGVRKIEPLKKKLSQLDAWICGLRGEQSTTREKLRKVEEDNNFGIIKVSPLANWNTERVWEYIKTKNIPYNKLHDKGYPSIGCGCCTRAIQEGDDIRSGRWWWEEPEHKECGLHSRPIEN